MSAKELTPAIHKFRWDTYVANDRHKGRTRKALGIPYGTVSSWLHNFRVDVLKEYGLAEPTEDFWVEYLRPPDPPPPQEIVIEPPDDPPHVTAIKIARLEQQVKLLRVENEALKREAIIGEDFRSAVLGLQEPLEPIAFGGSAPGESQAETIIVFLSDLQWGEVVDLAAMDGINSFNIEIGGARLKRFFEGVVELATKHWPGKPPERLILILGGDLISGDIHLELQKTNALSSIPAVRDLVAHLVGGVSLLLKKLKCPIDVISVPGNHGRSTLKPEAKNAVATSYDTLVSDFLELQFVKEPRVTFFVPASGDALFSVYGFQVLATHGDKIGSRGGAGFVGPAATVARGFKKLVAEYGAIGIHLDLILIGHFHTALELDEGIVNSSLVGPNEYARVNRFRPKPATQLFLSLHPRRGVTQVRRIQVGDASEGSIYAPRPAQPPRPRYRVKAVGVRA